jgi:hypothetical protein
MPSVLSSPKGYRRTRDCRASITNSTIVDTTFACTAAFSSSNNASRDHQRSKQQRRVKCDRYARWAGNHSCLSATSGSTRMARRAGR